MIWNKLTLFLLSLPLLESEITENGCFYGKHLRL